MYISQKNLARLLEYMATHVRYKERYDRELCRPLEDMNRKKIDSNLDMALAYGDMVETIIKEQGQNPEKKYQWSHLKFHYLYKFYSYGLLLN